MEEVTNLELLRLFRRINKLLHKCHQQNNTKGNFRGKGQLLAILSKQDGISQTMLAQEMDIARASMSELLVKVEKAGLVERRVDTVDKRMIRVYLTPLGKQKAIENQQYSQQLASLAFSKFSYEEMALLQPLVQKLINELDRIANDEYSLKVKILKELPEQITDINQMVVDIFKKPHLSEDLLKIRKSEYYLETLSLVAYSKQHLCGNVLFTLLPLKDYDNKIIALSLVAVKEEFQGHGIGTHLINDGIVLAKTLGYKGIIVVGKEAYFHRFGFKRGTEWNLSLDTGISVNENDHLLALELEKGVFKKGGTIDINLINL